MALAVRAAQLADGRTLIRVSDPHDDLRSGVPGDQGL